MAKVTNTYLDRDELRARMESNIKVPEIEALADFVVGQTSLRDRVAAGLMLFGGLRVEDMLRMQLSDVPSRLEIERVGAYRVELKVFGKSHKWRITSIPEWVYSDLRELASKERKILRKNARVSLVSARFAHQQSLPTRQSQDQFDPVSSAEFLH